jgi:hypothetical protein
MNKPFHTTVAEVIDKPEVAARIINEQARLLSAYESQFQKLNRALEVILSK